MIIDKIVIIATAIVESKDGEILLLKRSKKSSYENHWQLPEGKLEENEKPEISLTRELKEELHATINSMELFSANYTVLEAKGSQYLAFRMIFKVSLNEAEFKLSDEHTAYDWVKPHDIKSMDLLPGTSETIDSLFEK